MNSEPRQRELFGEKWNAGWESSRDESLHVGCMRCHGGWLRLLNRRKLLSGLADRRLQKACGVSLAARIWNTVCTAR
jgi:hypothetical protein